MERYPEGESQSASGCLATLAFIILIILVGASYVYKLLF